MCRATAGTAKSSNGGGQPKTWNERFQELVAYKEEHGHTLVPQKSGPLGVCEKLNNAAYRPRRHGCSRRLVFISMSTNVMAETKIRQNRRKC